MNVIHFARLVDALWRGFQSIEHNFPFLYNQVRIAHPHPVHFLFYIVLAQPPNLSFLDFPSSVSAHSFRDPTPSLLPQLPGICTVSNIMASSLLRSARVLRSVASMLSSDSAFASSQLASPQGGAFATFWRTFADVKGTFLDRKQVEERVVETVKKFDKVRSDPSEEDEQPETSCFGTLLSLFRDLTSLNR